MQVVPELPHGSHQEAFLCAYCWHYSKDKECGCNPKAPSFPVCFPSHQQPNFFPPLWRQQQRRLTSGTMEQLLITINGRRVAPWLYAFARLFYSFHMIRMKFPPISDLWQPHWKWSLKNLTTKSIFFVKWVYLEKSSVTEHFRCDGFIQGEILVTGILLNT